MNRYTLLSILAIVAVCIWFYWRQNNLRSVAREELLESNGTFDSHAERALESIEKINCPTPRDRFLAARIIDLNGNEGRINNVRVLNDVATKYMSNLLDEDGLDWFEMDQIENFAERHQDLIERNPRLHVFQQTLQEKRPELVKSSIDEAKRTARTKAEAFTNYVEGNQRHTNDPQNVHDSAVNEQLRTTYRRLMETTPAEAYEKASNDLEKTVKDHINSRLKEADRSRSHKALRKILEGQHNATIDANEKDLLTLVWARSVMGSNFSNKELIRDAVTQALLEMGDQGAGGVVCSNGRCARLLESLLLTDNDDEAIQGVLTMEEIRNDAMQKSNGLLQDAIEEFSSLDKKDTPLGTIARSYRDPDIVTSPEDETRFKSLVIDRIERMMQKEYNHRLPPKDYGHLRDHCIEAIKTI